MIMRKMDISPDVLLGRDESLLCELSPLNCRVRAELIAPLARLASAAKRAGFQLAVASSYRGFDRQLSIWNAKASGHRPVLDSQGQPLEMAALSDWEKVQAILRWSALPGTSRHHWGTDVDVYDAAAVDEHYQLQLTCAECEAGGPFTAFHQWLSERIASGDSEGFYRPYDRDRGGVAPEPWHLSYGPVADAFADVRHDVFLHQTLASVDIALKGAILAHLPEIMTRFVHVPLSPLAAGRMPEPARQAETGAGN